MQLIAPEKEKGLKLQPNWLEGNKFFVDRNGKQFFCGNKFLVVPAPLQFESLKRKGTQTAARRTARLRLGGGHGVSCDESSGARREPLSREASCRCAVGGGSECVM